MSTEIYRQTKLGDALVSALEELLENEKITPDLAIKVLSEVRILQPTGCCFTTLIQGTHRLVCAAVRHGAPQTAAHTAPCSSAFRIFPDLPLVRYPPCLAETLTRLCCFAVLS